MSICTTAMNMSFVRNRAELKICLSAGNAFLFVSVSFFCLFIQQCYNIYCLSMSLPITYVTSDREGERGRQRERESVCVCVSVRMCRDTRDVYGMCVCVCKQQKGLTDICS